VRRDALVWLVPVVAAAIALPVGFVALGGGGEGDVVTGPAPVVVEVESPPVVRLGTVAALPSPPSRPVTAAAAPQAPDAGGAPAPSAPAPSAPAPAPAPDPAPPAPTFGAPEES
jgi:hypothetical protein